MERRGYPDQRGEGIDYPERQGSWRMYEQLRGHRAQRPPSEACLGPPRPSLRRDRESLQACEGKQGSLRAPQHDQCRLPHHPYGYRAQGEPWSSLYHRLPCSRLRQER